MAEPSGPLNGQGRVVEGLVMIDGTTAFRRGRNRIARTDGGATQYVADQAMAWPPSVRVSQTPTVSTTRRTAKWGLSSAAGSRRTWIITPFETIPKV